MTIRINYPIETIHNDLLVNGNSAFSVLRSTGSKLADVALAGNPGGHKFEMTATVYHRNHDVRTGKAQLFRQGTLNIDTLASCFGTAYARAVDEKQSTLTFAQLSQLGNAVQSGNRPQVMEAIRALTGNLLTISQDGALLEQFTQRVNTEGASYNDIAALAVSLATGSEGNVLSCVQQLTGNLLSTEEDRTLTRRLLDARRGASDSVPTGPIEEGDFVQVSTADGYFRGVVVDRLTSRRTNETVSYLVQQKDGSGVAALASQVILVAKGS